MSYAENPETQNIALLKSIKLISLKYLKYIPTPVNGQISYNDLSIIDGQSFDPFYFCPETGTYEESDELTRAGSLWTKTINLTIPKLRAEVIAGLKKYEQQKLAALITDLNGTSLLVYPIRISRKKQIPGSFTAVGGTAVILEGRSSKESPIIINI